MVGVATAQALVYVHQMNIIHGDLKLSNVFMGKNNTPRIGDWGSSRQSRGATMTLSRTASVGYTESFAAFEVLDGKRTTSASDMYVDVVSVLSSLDSMLLGRACGMTWMCGRGRFSFGRIIEEVCAALDGQSDTASPLKEELLVCL